MYSKNRLIESPTTIKEKSVSMNLEHSLVDFNRMKVGIQTLDDAILRLSDFEKNDPDLANKGKVLEAISRLDYTTMRKISNYFYRVSGLYNRILRYMAFMYNYDWFVTPYMNDNKVKKEKVLEGFYKCLLRLDNFQVKKTMGEIALKVLRNGCYYAYKVEDKQGNITLQELPPNYCRTRYNYGLKPAVEFNMKYFDDAFINTEQRIRILQMFPKEFAKGYKLYKEGKLRTREENGSYQGWYLLDPEMTVKFNANGEDYPMFISTIPLLIDLDQAQGLNRKKMQQRLVKILVQKVPFDKSGELLLNMEELRQLHNNAVRMLQRAIGVEVLTTLADTSVESMVDSKSDSQDDDLERVERQFFNEAGISQLQFNTDGNIALEKSILNDEATMYNMVLQFEQFLNELLKPYNTNPKKILYRVQILKTTIYNYKELSKLYKEQMQVGFSKMLPQVALGQSQSSILANAYFENDVLELIEVFIPPLMSSTMNQEALGRKLGQQNGKQSSGRPEKPDDEKSTKTIQNIESQG